ncbi:MAG: hypothetical protein Q7V62_13040 [Actinomycetota bacterium]|nr:hypothetical protein [Actinomycetota bacterium]
MSGHFKRRLAAICAVALASTSGVWLASSTNATTDLKTYTATASTPELTVGTQSVSLTFKNTSRNRISFKAINVQVPPGLTVTGPVTVNQAGASAMLWGSLIKLRDLNTGRDKSVTVTFNATPTVQAACAPYTFVSDVRQSNDFNGQFNQFTLVGAYASMTGPCSSATITCEAADNEPCSTGTIVSPNGNTASVLLNDNDGISATLTASLVNAAITCAEYAPTSDQLNFDVDVTAGSLTGLTKTVTFTQPYGGIKQEWEYQACFQAPYDFPALLPSELAQDFSNSDFSGNTVEAPAGTFTGLLLPCGAGYGVPCLVDTVIDMGTAASGDETVAITVDVPAADPGMRF